MKTLTTTLKLVFAIGAMTFASQAIATPIFSENFDGMPIGQLFVGWTNTSLPTGQGNIWAVYAPVGDVNRFARILPRVSNSTVGNNAWLITPNFPLTQDEPVLVTFRLRRPSASALESLRIHIHTSRVPAAIQLQPSVWEIEDLPINEWVTVRIRFVPPSTANNFTIAFNARSPMHNNTGTPGVIDGGIIFIDDVAVLPIPDYDLGMERVPFRYTQIPEGPNPPPVVKITNTGNSPQNNVVVSALRNGVSVSLPAISTLAPGETVRVGFPAVNGQRDTLTSISVASDEFAFPDTLLRNDTITFIGTPNVLAQDRGMHRIPTTGMAFDRPGAIFGMVYEFAEPTNISQVMMGFSARTIDNFDIELYQIMDNNMVNPTPIFSQEATRNGIVGWQTFDIAHDSLIPAGRYLLAVNQRPGTSIWVASDNDASGFFHIKGFPTANRLATVQRSHTVATGGQIGSVLIGNLLMRLVLEADACTPATGLLVESGAGSATLTWTPVGSGSQRVIVMHGTDTVESVLLDGQTNRFTAMDVLTPGKTGYTWSITTHCDAVASTTATGPGFDAKNCAVPVIVVTDATILAGGGAHGINFEDDIFVCLEQEVTRLSPAGDPFYWSRATQVWTRRPSQGGFQVAQRTVLAMGNRARTDEDSTASTKLILPMINTAGITDDPMLRVRRVSTVHRPNLAADTLRVWLRTDGGNWESAARIYNGLDEQGGTADRFAEVPMYIELPKSATLEIAFEGSLTADGGGVYVDSMCFYSVTAGQLTVEGRSPGINATNVAIGTPQRVTATFNRNIRAGDNFSQITLVDPDGKSYKINATISHRTLTIHSERFFDTTTYTVLIPAGAVTNMAQSFSNTAVTWSFTTGREGIRSGVWTPPAGAAAVTPNTEISLSFANNVISADPDSLKKITLKRLIEICTATDTIILADTVPNVSVALDGRTLRFTNPELGFSTLYQVTIPAGSLHHQANEIRPTVSGQSVPWRFTTASLVVGVMGGSPNPGTNVAVDAPVWVRFSRAIEPFLDSTLLNQVTIKDAAGTLVAVAVRIVGDTLHIDREGNFQPNTHYTVTVPAMLVGNGNPIVWSFTTGTGTSILEPNSNENNVVIHPNPVSDVLHIQSQEPVLRVEIFSLQGRLLRQINEAVSEISVSDLSAGTYILKVTTAKGIATQRFIKQ